MLPFLVDVQQAFAVEVMHEFQCCWGNVARDPAREPVELRIVRLSSFHALATVSVGTEPGKKKETEVTNVN